MEERGEEAAAQFPETEPPSASLVLFIWKRRKGTSATSSSLLGNDVSKLQTLLLNF